MWNRSGEGWKFPAEVVKRFVVEASRVATNSWQVENIFKHSMVVNEEIIKMCGRFSMHKFVCLVCMHV